jgi:hypothetical protein
MQFSVRLLVVSVAGLLTACNAEPSFGPGSRADLPEVINELSIVKNSIGMQWSRPIRPTEPTVIPANCTYVAAVQSFTCPAQTLLGVTVTQSYTLLSARGDHQSAFDIAHTAAVQLHTVLAGRSSINGSDLAVDGQEFLTLSGLLTGEHTVDGTSSLHLNGALVAANPMGGGTSTTQIDEFISATVTRLVLQTYPSSIAGSYTLPRTGTIRVEDRTSIAGQPQVVSSALFPYDGTDRMVVVITRNGLSHTCEIPLTGIFYAVCL